MYLAREYKVECGLLEEVENINLRRVEVFLKKVRRAVWVLQGKKMAVLGLAFKGGTDDIRESPALRIVKCTAGGGGPAASARSPGHGGRQAADSASGWAPGILLLAL